MKFGRARVSNSRDTALVYQFQECMDIDGVTQFLLERDKDRAYLCVRRRGKKTYYEIGFSFEELAILTRWANVQLDKRLNRRG